MIIGSDHRVKENNTDCPLLLESRQYLGVQFHIRAQHMHPFLNSNLKISYKQSVQFQHTQAHTKINNFYRVNCMLSSEY